MLSSRTLVRAAVRAAVAVACVQLALASAVASHQQRIIVLGRNGRVVEHADSSLYALSRADDSSNKGAAAPSPPSPQRSSSDSKLSPSRVAASSSSKIAIYQVTRDAETAPHGSCTEQKQSAAAATAISEADLRASSTVEVVIVYSGAPGELDAVFTEHVAFRTDHESDGVTVHVRHEESDFDEFSHVPPPSSKAIEAEPTRQLLGVPEVTIEQSELSESALPGVPGSILFSEMSCLFVAFIGYLVHSIPLWSRFSRGQRWCLLVAFGAAVLYQVAAVSWYFDLVSPEVMVGLSSLITRMISLGMVPITTTSFIGRAREACSEQEQLESESQENQTQNQPNHAALPATLSSSSSRHARRHAHPRARAS